MPKDKGVVKTKAVFSNSSLSPTSGTCVSLAMRSSGSIGSRALFGLLSGMCCPHGKACGGHLSSLSVQQSMLGLHTTSLWAAKTVECACAPHPTSCSQLVRLLPQMLLDFSVFAAAVPSCLFCFPHPSDLVRQGWAEPYPFLTLRLLLELTEQQEMCSSFQPCSLLMLALSGFFPQGLFFLTVPCVGSLICLFRRFGNVTGKADEYQG